MKFKLDIYTWPAMCGVDPGIRSTNHETPEGASKHVASQTEPFAHAVLQSETTPGVFNPCDWDGNLLNPGQRWPHRLGVNGQHPAVESLKMDWDTLIALVQEQYDGTRGMMDIAGELLKERHPDVHGWAHDLAWAAAE